MRGGNNVVDEVRGNRLEDIIKEEDVLDVVPALSDDLTADAKNAFEILSRDMVKYVSFHTTHFKELDPAHADVTGEEIQGEIDLVLADPPYNIRREAGRHNSSHDVLSDDSMSDFTEVVVNVRKEGGHAVIFCDFLQFAKWHEKFSDWEMPSQEEESGDEITPKDNMESLFTIERSPLQFIRRQGNYNSNPIVKKTTHTNITDIAVHL